MEEDAVIRCGSCGNAFFTLKNGMTFHDPFYGPMSRFSVDLKGCEACGVLLLECGKVYFDEDDRKPDATIKKGRVVYTKEFVDQVAEFNSIERSRLMFCLGGAIDGD